ncbi:MAG: 3D domain-containing protein [Clostridiales bacterium]|nr:3D domain-containing protein [Clostridiales bacterium]
MFLQRHKGRLICAAALFAAFLVIGSAAQNLNITNNEAAPDITPDITLSAPTPDPEVKVGKTATYASQAGFTDTGETIPAITVEEPVLILPADADEAAEPPEEASETQTQPAGETAAPAPYLSYYEKGHFKPGEDGVLITADGEEIRYSSVIQVSATAYTTERQENKITATGTVAHVGGIAVDPKVIPYGTKMYILSEAGAWAYGYAVAEDCGGGIKGNKVDLFFDTYDECIQFGVRNALIYILEEQ